jgi:hypothetical protein
MNEEEWKNRKKIKTWEKKNNFWDFVIRMIAALFGQGY